MLTKTTQKFNLGKPWNDSSKICTNLRVSYSDDSQDIAGDLRPELEEEDIILGLHRVKHQNVVKVGIFLGMMDKINLKEWKNHFQKLLFTFLELKPFIYLQASKINKSSFNKSTSGFIFKVLTRNKPKKIGAQVETISLQKYSARRALKHVLSRIDKDLHGVELRLVLVLTCKTDEIVASHVAIKHKHATRNIKQFEIYGYDNIDHPITPGSELALRKLIIDIKEKDVETLAVTITSNWKNALELWIKNTKNVKE